MTAVAERILDLALREVLGGEQPPDLTIRILAAARAEADGSAGATASAPWRRRRWIAGMIAAALILAAGLAFVLQPTTPAKAPTVATADSLLLTFTKDGEATLDRFAAGQTVFVPGPSTALITLESGATISVWPRSALRFEADGDPLGVTLLWGAFLCRNEGAQPVHLATPTAAVRVPPNADARIELLQDPWVDAEALESIARHRALAVLDDEAVVVVESRSGGVALDAGASMGAWGFGVCWPDGVTDIGVLPPKTVRSELTPLVTEARLSSSDLPPDTEDRVRRIKAAQAAAGRIGALLKRSPEAWTWVRPALHRLPREAERNDVRRRLLQILLGDPHERTRALFTRVLRTGPEVLDLDSVLVLAERGLDDAVGRLDAILEDPRAPGRPDSVFAALHFALRGDARGHAVLEANAANQGLVGWNQAAWYGAVAGLVLLGDDAAWDDMIAWLGRTVEERLAAGLLGAAQTHVLSAAYFHAMLQAGEPVPVSQTRVRMLMWSQSRMAEAGTPEGVRRVLDSIRDLGH